VLPISITPIYRMRPLCQWIAGGGDWFKLSLLTTVSTQEWNRNRDLYSFPWRILGLYSCAVVGLYVFSRPKGSIGCDTAASL